MRPTQLRSRTPANMLLVQAGGVFMVLFLCISGVDGDRKGICALKGSKVELICSILSSTITWSIVNKNGSQTLDLKKLSVNGRVTSSVSEDQHTLTINNVTKSDAKTYCCSDKLNLCRENEIQLTVSDVEVKLVPAAEAQTVNLICSISCVQTDVYVWFKNGEFLYEDWSPWYQELVSSEEGVTYSCAVKGHEGLRAPDVSVDSVTSTCFTVTYSKGTICSHQQTTDDESCSVTFPRELRVKRTSQSPVTLICSHSCHMTEQRLNFSWFQNRRLHSSSEKQQISVSEPSNSSFSCAVKGLEHLSSPEVCAGDQNCQTVNYQTRRICAVEGSSVDISCEYSHPYNRTVNSPTCYKMKHGQRPEKMHKVPGRVEIYDNKKQYTMRIHNLNWKDSGEFVFILQRDVKGWMSPDVPGVTLTVTGLEVKFIPRALMTEGQNVTVTCSTSCPLSGNTNYMWFLNNQLLPQSRDKHLRLHSVSRQQEGKYSCAVRIRNKNIDSDEVILTVISIEKEKASVAPAAPAAAAFAVAASVFLVLIVLFVFWWIRKMRNRRQTAQSEASGNMEQINSAAVYENMSEQPTEQDPHHYDRLLFSEHHTDDCYSTLHPG